MPRYTLRPTVSPARYDFLIGGARSGLVYREGVSWVLALDVAPRPGAAFQSFADLPADLRANAGDEHPTLASLCAELGIAIGGPIDFRDAA